jgi:spore germination protein KB
MIHPAARLSRRDAGKYLYSGFAVGAITLLITTLRDIGVLGNTVDLFTVPSLMTLRLVHMGPSISRTEILFSVIFIILLFFKITVLFYVTVLTVAQLFNIKSYQHLILTVGSLLIVYGITLYPNPQKHAASAQEVEPVIWTLFELLLPLLALVLAKIRKLPKVKEA